MVQVGRPALALPKAKPLVVVQSGRLSRLALSCPKAMPLVQVRVSRPVLPLPKTIAFGPGPERPAAPASFAQPKPLVVVQSGRLPRLVLSCPKAMPLVQVRVGRPALPLPKAIAFGPSPERPAGAAPTKGYSLWSWSRVVGRPGQLCPTKGYSLWSRSRPAGGRCPYQRL